MFKKSLLVMVLGLMLVLTACGGKKDQEVTQVVEKEVEPSKVDDKATDEPIVVEEEVKDEVEVEEPVVEEVEEVVPEVDLTGLALNPLTGLYIKEDVAATRPFGVMINNHRKAIPQSGISQADVMYETLVEGGICRLFAVFQDFDAPKIGPVRSARHYYLDFSFDFDAYYVHYGRSPQASNAFVELNAPNMDGMAGLDYISFYQDPNRKRPHSTYTSYEGLIAGRDHEEYRVERQEDFNNKLVFAKEEVLNESGEVANKVTLDYSYYQYAWFEYDTEAGLYNRFQFDNPHIDVETGEQLTYKNVMIQVADMWKIKGDTEGRLDMALVGEGEGYYVTSGKVVPMTWSKATHYEPTVYYDENGEVLEINTGKTWISIFPSYRPEGILFE